ncbi:MAG: translocation/assembly module TamB domain-containing protein [Saprospiraceae bacterium]
MSRWLALTLLGLFLLTWVLLQQPAIQQWAVKKLTQQLSHQFQTNISVNKVNIRFFKTVLLEGIYVEDQSGDTLLYAGRLAAKISLFSFISHTLHVEDIALENAVLNLRKMESDTAFNFAFLGNNTKASTVDTVSQFTWDIDLKKLNIDHVQLRFQDEKKCQKGTCLLEHLSLKLNQLDLARQVLEVEHLRLTDSKVAWTLFPHNLDEAVTDTTLSNGFSFPAIPWYITIKAFEAEQNAVSFHNEMTPDTSNRLDFNHLQLNDLSINLEGFEWHEKVLKGKLDHFSFEERSGLKLNDMTFDVTIDSNQIKVETLALETPLSQLWLSLQVDLPHQTVAWKDILLNGAILPSKIAFADLKEWLPALGEWVNVAALEATSILLSGRVSGSLGALKGEAIELRLGKYLALSGDMEVRDWWKGNGVFLKAYRTTISSAYRDLAMVLKKKLLPLGLAEFGAFWVGFSGEGNLENFRVESFDALTSSGTTLTGRGMLRDFSNWEKASFEVGLKDCSTTAGEWRGFIPTLPPMLDSLGLIKLAANAQGLLRDFEGTAMLESEIGLLNLDFKLQPEQDFSSAAYVLQADLKDFDIEKIMPTAAIKGPLEIHVEGEGKGLDWQTLTASFEGNVKGISYRDYAYPSLQMQGQLSEGLLSSQLMTSNAAIALALKSKLKLTDSMPTIDLELDLQQLAAKSLHLTDSTLNVQFTAKGHFQGRNLDELQGHLAIDDLRLANDTLHYATSDLQLLASLTDDGKRNLSFQSAFLTLAMEGHFQLSRLGELGLGLIDHHFQLGALLDSTWTATLDSLRRHPALQDQSLQAKLQLQDPLPLRIVALHALHRLDALQLTLSLDHPAQTLAIDATLDTLHYGEIRLAAAHLTMKGDQKSMSGQGVIIPSSLDYPELAQIELTTTIGNDSLQWALEVTDTAATQQIQVEGALTQLNKQYNLRLAPAIVLGGKAWDVAKNHSIYLKPGWFFIQHLLLQHEQQYVGIEQQGALDTTAILPLKLSFEAFEINEITKVLQYPDSLINGKINGAILLHDLGGKPYFTADLGIADLLWKEQEVGQLQLLATQKLAESTIGLKLGLQGSENQIALDGYYQTDAQELNLQATIESLNLALLDPLSAGVLTQNKGLLSGTLDVTGKLAAPVIKGTFRVRDFTTQVPFANAHYKVPFSLISLDQQNISIDSTFIEDELGHRVSLGGVITHQHYSNFQLALRAETDKFRFLNTTMADNELFFGQLMIKAGIRIEGPLAAPHLEIDATTLAPSSFSLSPFSVTESIVNADDYVIFTTPDAAEKILDKSAFSKVKNSFPFDIRINLELTDAAEFQFIIDPVSGDKLVCRGDANLILRMMPSGDIQLSGVYTVSSGTYSFSYGQLLHRKFAIEKGGKVYFNGNPLDARFDLRASYGLKTTTYALLDSDSQLDPTEEEKSKERQTLNVMLQLKGDLNKPAINFSIEMPDQQGDAVSSNIQRKLNTLNNNPNELNQQVFSLLLFKNFMQKEQAISADVTAAGEQAAFSSVASLFSTQLNKLAENYVKGVEINFDIDAYKSEQTATSNELVTQLDVDLSKQFFNDRLKIKAGTNVDLRSSGNQANVSTFSGDYVLEYKLNKKGNYLLRVFRKDEFDVLLEENTAKTGFSIFLKKAFDGKKK